MKKITILILLLLPLLIISKELKIASYNVENLFDTVNNGTEYDSYKPNTHNWNRSTLRKKLKNITKVICDLDADVIALQEIENANALKLLQNSLKRAGCNYRYSAITDKKGSSIQVALLSKVKIKNTKAVQVSRFKGDRDILEVTLNTKPPLTIFVNHWRSKRAKESARVKSAKALMKRIEKMPKDREYIILGDFNSRHNECSVIEDKFNDTNGVCGIDKILKTYYRNKFLKLKDKPPLDIYHYNLWSEVEPHKRWSYNYYGKKMSIDSIIISKNLNDRKGWYYKKGSFGVFKEDYLFKKNNKVFKWEYKNSKHTGKGYSDHLPVYATFATRAKRVKKETKSKEDLPTQENRSWLDILLKMILPAKKDNRQEEVNVAKGILKEYSVNELAKKSYVGHDVILKNACVVFKRGDTAVVKSSKNSRAITLYKCAEEVKEGICYELLVHKKKRYFGLDEIVEFDIIKKIKKIDPNKFIKKFNPKRLKSYFVGDVVRDIKGVYNNRHIYVSGIKIKLYSKVKKKGLFKKGYKLFIKKAQIGYYKGTKELIIYSLKDIIKEN